MSWMATERFRARPAPGGLALVQELVNTHAVERGDTKDLLADRTLAQLWLQGAARQWADAKGVADPDLAFGRTDLATVVDLRSVVAEMLVVPPDQRSEGAPSNATVRTPANLVADQDGRVGIEPAGTDGRWLESAVWAEILVAQLTGTWSRLKLCREPGCRSAFYDTTRNRSGVWHDVHSCGNITNLRASRTRKKLQDQ